MKVKKSDLVRLLTAVQRKAVVAGKLCPQVFSCVLRPQDGKVSVTSLVRDGKTSLSSFNVEGEFGDREDLFVIPDIEMMLGALKAHGDEITIAWTRDKKGDGKIRIGSKLRTGSLKRTTLMANENALAFPSSTVSILEWEEKSLDRSDSIVLEPSSLGKYITGSGNEIEAYSQALVKVSDLKEALSAGSINGQRLGRVEFRTDEPDEEGVCILEVVVGSELKGKTVTPIGDSERGGIKALTVEGGLENAIEFFDDDDLLILDFFDFTEYGQGLALGIRSIKNDSWIYQRGVL